MGIIRRKRFAGGSICESNTDEKIDEIEQGALYDESEFL